jgi:hypothetical protein
MADLGLIPPELQRVIDQVMNYAKTPVGGARGITAAQGRAMEGVGQFMGGMVNTASTLASQQNIASEARKTQLGIAEMETKPKLMEAERLSTPLSSGSGYGMANKPSGSESTTNDWRSKYKFSSLF